MPDVFISYSRQNLEFVHQLVVALKNNGKDPWFDQLKEPLSGIAAGAPWWEQIKSGIESVDNFLFVITPNSMSSPYCHAEINYAREHGKRLVPVLYCGWIGEGETRKTIDAAIEAIPDDEEIPNTVTAGILNLKKLVRANWLAISEIQYVLFTSSITFEQSLEQVIQALDLDLAWVRMHSQLVQAAKLWEANGFDDEYLWGANRLKPVYEMIERRKPKPQLDPLVQDFIQPEQERLLRQIDDIRTSHQQRVAIGDRLALIGDIRPGVGVKHVPQPGQAELAIPEMVWCRVEAHPKKGGMLKHKQRPTVEIEGIALEVQPFYIARYLVTHQQFQVFLDDLEGVNDPRWWQGIPEKYQKSAVVAAQNQFENAPRDAVTWYQALAFTRWLDFRYRTLKRFEHLSVYVEGKVQSPTYQPIRLNPDEWQIRLPTEWEWQWAAQNGEEGREYPWVGKWDDQPRANTNEAGINSRSTAVGMYPDGTAACGALDMAGNLFEWCLNDHGEIKQISLDNGQIKVVRGGSFSVGRSSARASVRGSNAPYYGYGTSYYGFRVVLGSPIGNLNSVPLRSGL